MVKKTPEEYTLAYLREHNIYHMWNREVVHSAGRVCGRLGLRSRECIPLRSSRHELVGIVVVSRERHGTKFV